MAFQWVLIANIMGPPGDAAAVAALGSLDTRVRGLTGNVLVPRLTSSDWAHVFQDKDGWVLGGIKTNGDWVIPGSSMTLAGQVQMADVAAGFTRSDRTRWAVPGDSLSSGFDSPGGAWDPSEAWPMKLQALLPAGVSVFNRALSGHTVDEIAVKIGAIPWVLSGTIPASGAGTLTSPTVIGWRGNINRSILGTLGGIPGTIAWDYTTGTITFTRTTAGTSTPVTAAVFVPEWDVHRDDSMVIFLGRNDVTYGTVGAEANTVDHVVAGVGRIAAYLGSKVRRLIIVSVTTTTLETSGSAGYNTVTSINTKLAANWGDKFLDLRRYLVTQAIYDLGITPTSGDLSNMAADTLPPSIMAPTDPTHYSKATAALIAQKQFLPFITRRGWV